MSERVFKQPPGAVPLMLRALLTGARRPGPVARLSGARRVMPSVPIDREHLARYNALCGFGGVERTQVPITYPQVLAFSLTLDYLVSEECPWPAVGVVHLANRIRQRIPIGVDDVLSIELAPGTLFAHPRGQVFTLEIRVSRGGELVWEGTQTLLRRGVAQPTGEPFDPGATTSVAFHEAAALDVPADTGRRYARVSGDFNPIHLSAITARLFGFRRAIAHGLWSQARALSMIEPSAGAHPAELSTVFMSPLMLPARATLWTSGDASRNQFELRDAQGERVHFRSDWACVSP